jgi:hypothetical protein
LILSPKTGERGFREGFFEESLEKKGQKTK